MRIAVRVSSIDRGQRLIQLGHLLSRTGIQGILYYRLVGTGAAAKGGLQRRVAAQAGVDLTQAMRAGQDADKGVVEFVDWRILDRLLSNLHGGPNGTK